MRVSFTFEYINQKLISFNDWLIEAYYYNSPGFYIKRLKLVLEQWSWGQSSGAISITGGFTQQDILNTIQR